MKIVITGSNGFIGKNLVKYLRKYKYQIYKLSIDFNNKNAKELIHKILIELKPNCIIHLAGVAHNKYYDDKSIININTNYTSYLTDLCNMLKIKKFIYLSSIGVLGENSENTIFNEESKYKPYNLYTLSKMNAEKYIIKNFKNRKTKYTIIRSSLIVGKNAPGNIKLIKKFLKIGIPLPVSGFKNKRNIIHISDLCNLIFKCLSHKESSNQIFVASGAKPLTPLEIFQEVANIEGLRFSSFYIPKKIIFIVLNIIGKNNIANKFNKNLLIDSSKARDFLEWNSKI